MVITKLLNYLAAALLAKVLFESNVYLMLLFCRLSDRINQLRTVVDINPLTQIQSIDI